MVTHKTEKCTLKFTDLLSVSGKCTNSYTICIEMSPILIYDLISELEGDSLTPHHRSLFHSIVYIYILCVCSVVDVDD
jgi:hypothetical protein